MPRPSKHKSRGVKRTRTRVKGAMKKTTTKGAYKKARVKNMVKRRNPMVETKKRVHGVITAMNTSSGGVPSANYQDTVGGLTIPNNDAFTLLNLASYYRNSHGFGEHNVIGDALFSKYLKLKIQMRFPEGTSMIVNPVKLYLITGWCTQPSGWTNNTTPTEGDSTQTYLFAHITNQLKEYFDEREDFLRFREKTTSNVRILRWQKLAPNLNQSIAAVPAQVIDGEDGELIRTVGAVPFVNRSFTWRTFKKVHLSEGKELATGNDAAVPDTQNLYPNNQWLPFAIIYNPDFARMRDVENDDTTCTLAYNDVHYYGDA